MLLEVRSLTKQYSRGRTMFKAVSGVSLTVSPGDFVSIIGRSGSGKSTLLNLIAGLLKPTSGSIILGGQDVTTLDDKAVSWYRNLTIGYIPQGYSTLSNLTVLDNVRLPHFLMKHTGDVTEKALSLLKEVGVHHLAAMYPGQLSGGELRRVTIARSLINEPVLLMADEPTSDLDAQTTGEIMSLFSRIAQNGTAILMVTHEPDTLDFASRVFSMESGILTDQKK